MPEERPDPEKRRRVEGGGEAPGEAYVAMPPRTAKKRPGGGGLALAMGAVIVGTVLAFGWRAAQTSTEAVIGAIAPHPAQSVSVPSTPAPTAPAPLTPAPPVSSPLPTPPSTEQAAPAERSPDAAPTPAGACRITRGGPETACRLYVKDGEDGWPHATTGCAEQFYTQKFGCAGSDEQVASCMLAQCQAAKGASADGSAGVIFRRRALKGGGAGSMGSGGN